MNVVLPLLGARDVEADELAWDRGEWNEATFSDCLSSVTVRDGRNKSGAKTIPVYEVGRDFSGDNDVVSQEITAIGDGKVLSLIHI